MLKTAVSHATQNWTNSPQRATEQLQTVVLHGNGKLKEKSGKYFVHTSNIFLSRFFTISYVSSFSLHSDNFLFLSKKLNSTDCLSLPKIHLKVPIEHIEYFNPNKECKNYCS